MYERVLVPTDGGDRSVAAARHAVDLAGAHGATVHAIYVVETGTNWLTVSKTEVRDALRDVGRAAADEALARVETLAADAGGDLVTSVLQGSPDEAILRYAADHDVDIVVMGTHGRDGLERRLVGSVAERVVRDARAPVLTVNASAES